MKLKLVLVPEPWAIMIFWYNPKMLQLDEFGSKLVAENKIWKKKKTMAPQADESKTLLPHRNAALGLNITQIF